MCDTHVLFRDIVCVGATHAHPCTQAMTLPYVDRLLAAAVTAAVTAAVSTGSTVTAATESTEYAAFTVATTATTFLELRPVPSTRARWHRLPLGLGFCSAPATERDRGVCVPISATTLAAAGTTLAAAAAALLPPRRL